MSTLEGLAKRSGNRRFALDSYRRLIQMYGDVVAGLERHELEAPLMRLKNEHSLEFDHQLTEAHLEYYHRRVSGYLSRSWPATRFLRTL